MGGQTDRFGQPIPASPGYQTILNPDGSQPQMRNILRLGAGITATDDPNSEATRFDIDVSVGGSVQIVDAVSNLRGDLFLLGPSTDKIYVTKNYKVSSDTGGMQYRWNATDTTTDDGVLHVKNSFHSTGRFQPVKPADGMINAQACGPKLTDVGSIGRSFDPTGASVPGTEMKRITALLRNAGWSGIVFGKDLNGNGTYAVSGAENVGPSTLPWVPFRLQGADGAGFVSNSPGNPSAFICQAEGESALVVSGYGPRYWTQTIVGGERIFPGVADITGLSVGDTMFVRISSNTTDFSGQPYCYFFGVIKSITPGTGTTGTIETWECVPEPAPLTSPGNPSRLVNKHDMVKVTGFQDLVTIDSMVMNDVGINLSSYRNMTIDCHWSVANFVCINGDYGIGLEIPRITVGEAHGVNFANASIITLAQQYDTHVGHMVISDLSPRFAGLAMHVITEESLCRGTRIDFADITCNVSSAAVLSNFCGQTPGQDNLVSVGMLVIKGYGSLGIGDGACFECIDVKSAIPADHFLDPANVNSLIWQGKMYRRKIAEEYIMPIAASATNVIALPNHGITAGLRLKFLSLTGVTDVLVSGDNFSTINVSVLSEVTSGQWSNVNTAANTLIFRPNWIGYNTLSLKVTTDGTSPFNWVAIRHSCFEIDLTASITSTTDTTVPATIVFNGSPTASSSVLGQMCFDSTNAVWYRSVSVGSGAADWTSTSSKKIPSGASASGSVIFTEIAAPGAPGGSKVVMWADSTDGSIKSKDNFGIISVQPIVTAAVANQFVTGLTGQGVFITAQPSSANLSDLAAVALTNADATIVVGGGSYYALAASTLTGLHTLTLGNTGAVDKQAIQVRVYSQGSNYLINDSAASLLLSVASGTKVVATFVWATGTGKFQLQSWNFFT